MKKNRIIVFICIGILFFSLIGISFAMVSMSLDIRGNMKVASGNWDVHFENLQKGILQGSVIEVSKPYLSDKSTSLLNINAKVLTPDDAITYLFDVVNAGEIDAVLSSIQTDKPVCSGSGDNAVADASQVCQSVRFELTYQDNSKLKEGDLLKAKEKRGLKLRLYYDGTTLPINEVDVGNLSMALIYTQS